MEECDALLAVPAEAESDVGDPVCIEAKVDVRRSAAVPGNSIVSSRKASGPSLAPPRVRPCSSRNSPGHGPPSRAVSTSSTEQLDLLCYAASAPDQANNNAPTSRTESGTCIGSVR